MGNGDRGMAVLTVYQGLVDTLLVDEGGTGMGHPFLP